MGWPPHDAVTWRAAAEPSGWCVIPKFFGPAEACVGRLCDVCGTPASEERPYQVRAKCCNLKSCRNCASECILEDQKCYRCPQEFIV